MDDLELWRWNDELSVRQAALLAVGIDPAGERGSCCEDWKPHERPSGYEAAKQAITNALRKNAITGKITPIYHYDINGNPYDEEPDSVDIELSQVDVDSLKTWLAGRDLRPSFFFPASEQAPDYLSPEHPRYSAKLAAAVKVWQAMEDSNLTSGKSPSAAMSEWLTSRYKELGLVWKGKITKEGIKEIAKVANWNPDGGAPKTPTSK